VNLLTEKKEHEKKYQKLEWNRITNKHKETKLNVDLGPQGLRVDSGN